MTIELTKEEAGILLQLIDLAVKSGGLNVAGASVVIANKIQESANAEDSKSCEA